MSTEYSVEEVRAAINGFVGYSHTHHGIGGDLIGIAQAYAECIVADESAVPDCVIVLLNHLETLMDGGKLAEDAIPTEMWNAVSMHNYTAAPSAPEGDGGAE